MKKQYTLHLKSPFLDVPDYTSVIPAESLREAVDKFYEGLCHLGYDRMGIEESTFEA